MESLSALLPIIQLAITPVILISGIGALMFTLTSRMARIVDRTRVGISSSNPPQNRNCSA